MTARLLLVSILFIAGSARADTPAKPAPGKPEKPGPSAPPAPPASKVKDVEAGPLFNQAEAEQTCPGVCKPPTKWNGTWRTTKPSVMSVCGCAEPAPPPAPPPPPPPAPRGTVRELEAGPLYDQKEASAKCPKLCVAPAVWNGGWRTVKASVMSLCACEDPPPPPPKVVVQPVDTSAIRSSTDARTKCTAACAPPRAWNGEWRAKGNKAATCECTATAPSR